MFADSDGDTFAVFNIGGGGGSDLPVPDLPPQLSRHSSPITIPVRKPRQGRPSRTRLFPPAAAAASPPSARQRTHDVLHRELFPAAPQHAVLEREANQGPMQIARAPSAAAASAGSAQIKRSASSDARAEASRIRDLAIADAQRRGIRAQAWDRYPGGVKLEMSDSDTETDDETQRAVQRDTPQPAELKAADALRTEGVVVLQLFSAEEVKRYRQRLLEEELPAMPEFAHPITKYTDGGFGALANPGSFHNATVRELRMEIAKRTWKFFKVFCQREYPGQSGWRLEQLLDRLALRPRGSSTSEETWHRDESPTSDPVFGGWVNLDLPMLGGAVGGTQYFSCNLRTHRVARPDGVGFVKLKKKTPEFEAAKAAKVVVSVPPGHWVVFYQNLIHEVHPNKMSYDSLRLFVGFRLTRSPRPLFDEVQPGTKPEERAAFGGVAFKWRQFVFEDQGVPPIPSSQFPPLYAAATLNFRKPQLMAWSAELTPPYQQPEKGYPVRYMKSLKAAGLPMYPKYEEAEVAIHTPRLLLDDDQAAPGMNASASSSSSSSSAPTVPHHISAKEDAIMAIVENSALWKHFPAVNPGQFNPERMARRRTQTQIAIRKLLMDHEWEDKTIPLDWSFTALRALIVTSEPRQIHDHDNRWEWWEDLLRKNELRDIEEIVRIWAIVTGREPTPEERERMYFCFDVYDADLLIDKQGAPEIPARFRGDYEERYLGRTRQAWHAVNAQHNARVQVRLAAERDVFRGATDGERYGDLPPELISLVGSFHTAGITFNDGSSSSSSQAEPQGLVSAYATLSPEVVQAREEQALALIQSSEAWKRNHRPDYEQTRQRVHELLTQRRFRGYLLPLDWSFRALHTLILGKRHRTPQRPFFYNWGFDWWEDVEMDRDSREIDLLLRFWTIITGVEPDDDGREQFEYFWRLRDARLDIDKNGAMVDADIFNQQTRDRFAEISAPHNAFQNARRAAERAEFRAATEGQRYGGMPPELMSLIGSYHTAGITINDGSGVEDPVEEEAHEYARDLRAPEPLPLEGVVFRFGSDPWAGRY